MSQIINHNLSLIDKKRPRNELIGLPRFLTLGVRGKRVRGTRVTMGGSVIIVFIVLVTCCQESIEDSYVISC